MRDFLGNLLSEDAKNVIWWIIIMAVIVGGIATTVILIKSGLWWVLLILGCALFLVGFLEGRHA